MPRSNSDGEDSFFDATDSTETCARISIDSTIHDECINTSSRNPKSVGFMHSCGPFKLSSVHERRSCFFKNVGISENVSSQSRIFHFEPEIDEILEIERFAPLTRDTVSETPTCSANSESERNYPVCSKDDHTDRVLVLHDEARTPEIRTFQNFEALNSISEPADSMLERGLSDGSNNASAGKINIVKRWWSFPAKWKMQTYETSMIDHLQVKEPRRTNVERHRKRCMDFTSVFMDQELRAHKGPIRVVKFSPSGRHLATGGEDSAVKVWEIREVESLFGCYNQGVFSEPKEKPKGIMGIEMLKKSSRSGLAIIPKQIFQIVEKPLHKFRAHTAGILDLCWSKSDVCHSSYDQFVFSSS
jgi:WD repeat-containing protein 44